MPLFIFVLLQNSGLFVIIAMFCRVTFCVIMMFTPHLTWLFAEPRQRG